jgi:hypothetical protein
MLGNSKIGNLLGTSHVEYMHNSSHVEYMHNSSQVGIMYDSSKVGTMYDSSKVGVTFDSSKVGIMYDSSKVGCMHGSSKVVRMYDSSVENMYDSSKVGCMYGFSKVVVMCNSSKVVVMCNSSKVGDMHGSSKVVRMYDSSKVGVMYDSSKVISNKTSKDNDKEVSSPKVSTIQTAPALEQKKEETTMNVKKDALPVTNSKAVVAVKAGLQQAGARTAHKALVAQVQKVLGGKFPKAFFSTPAGKALLDIGSCYLVLAATEAVDHPLAGKANAVALLAMTAATYDHAAPLMEMATKLIESAAGIKLLEE